jgi:hypothetical protein
MRPNVSPYKPNIFLTFARTNLQCSYNKLEIATKRGKKIQTEKKEKRNYNIVGCQQREIKDCTHLSMQPFGNLNKEENRKRQINYI